MSDDRLEPTTWDYLRDAHRQNADSTIVGAAVDGVERGDFFIVTHPAALTAATRRYNDIVDAFAAQAAWYPARQSTRSTASLRRSAQNARVA